MMDNTKYNDLSKEELEVLVEELPSIIYELESEK